MPPSVLHAQMDIIVRSPILQHQQENVRQDFSVDEAQTLQDLPFCQQLEDLARRDIFVNWAQHIHEAVEEEHITLMKAKLLVLSAQQGTSALRIQLPLNPILAQEATTVPMGLNMQHNFHAVRAFTMVLRRG